MKYNIRLTDDCEYDCPECGEPMVATVEVDLAGNMSNPLNEPFCEDCEWNRKVTVCDKCLTAACWQGEFMCDEARSAGITEKTVAELTKLNREHPHYWRIQDGEGRPVGSVNAQ